MPRDGDVIVVQDQLHVKVLCDREARRFGIVALHLGTVGAKAEHDLAWVRKRDAVHVRPHVTEAAGAELDARREAHLGVTRKLGAALAVEAQKLRVDQAVQRRHQVLRRDAVASFIEEDRHELVRAGAEEGVHHHDLRHRVEGSAGVATIAAGRAARREEHDCVAAQVDVKRQVL